MRALVRAMAPSRGDAEGAAPIKDFYGQFKGQGIAKNRDSLEFYRSLRDLDTIIEAAIGAHRPHAARH